MSRDNCSYTDAKLAAVAVVTDTYSLVDNAVEDFTKYKIAYFSILIVIVNVECSGRDRYLVCLVVSDI